MANLGKVRYNLKGDWVSTTAYLINDMVRHKNRTYRCILAHTNAQPITTNIGVYWELMVGTFEDQGAYAAGTTYYVGDVVTVDNPPYVVSGVGGLGSSANPRTFVSTSTSGAIPFNQVNTYVCLATSTGNAPVPGTTTGFWAPLAQSGVGGRNNKSYAWGANMGIVPFGTYPPPAGAGWPPDAGGARPGDSKYDGGLGYHAAGQQTFRVSYISKSGAIIQWGRSNNSSQGRGNDGYQMSMAEMTFPHNEWYDNTLPTPDGLAPKALQLEMGYQNNLCLFNNGEVYAWGYNGHGAVGNATTGDNQGTYPYRCGNNNGTTVLRGLKAVRIASTMRMGSNTAVSNYALMSNGQLYAWGYNGYGQLGVGDTAVRNVPTLVNQGNLGGSAIVDIFAQGNDYGILHVITANGNMYACGYNGYGELGIGSTANQSLLTFSKAWGTTTTRIRKFVTSTRQSASSAAVLAADGTLWTWGFNNYGQLALNDTTQRNSPTQVTFPFSTGWTNVWYTAGAHTQLFATNSNAAPTTYPGYTATTNALYSCGYNGYYTLGRLVTVNANLTHANVSGTANVQNDTYRLLPVYADINGTAPIYGILDNIHDVQSWVNQDNSYSAIYFERTTGEKYFSGYNGYGNFGHGHSDSYLARTFDSSNFVANNLPKRIRNMPSGMREADFFMVNPLGWSNYFGALWADKWGHTYFIGGGSDNGWNSTQPDVQQGLPANGQWVGHYIKTPEM
jgi:alpha-tubulin suppressor-like RCC1 family protein